MYTRYFFFLLLFVTTAGAQQRERIVAHLLADIETLNPLFASGLNDLEIGGYIFETLFAIDHTKFEYSIPLLAASLPKESKDHLTYDVQLRKGIVWADGKPFTGNDVIFSAKALHLQLGLGVAHSYAAVIEHVELIANDPYRVRFKLNQPYPLFRDVVLGTNFFILPKHIYDPEDISDEVTWEVLADTLSDSNALDLAAHMRTLLKSRDPKYYQGTGPYKLKAWRAFDRIELEANLLHERCATKKKCPLPLMFKVITDWNAAITALKAKDIDVISFIQLPYYDHFDVTRFSYIRKEAFPTSNYSHLGWNHKSTLFRDRRVRRALSHLIKRDSLIASVIYGLGVPIQSPVFFRRPEYFALPPIAYDKQKAITLLREAGWEDRDGDGVLDATIDGTKVDFAFSFLVNAGNILRKQTLARIAESLTEVGIKAKVEAVEWTVFLDRIRNHDFDARYGSWSSEAHESDNYFLYHSSQAEGGNNYDVWSNPRVDEILENLHSEFNKKKRKALWKEFQQIYYEDQPETILWLPLNPTLWNNKFKNVKFYPATGKFNYDEWELR